VKTALCAEEPGPVGVFNRVCEPNRNGRLAAIGTFEIVQIAGVGLLQETDMPFKSFAVVRRFGIVSVHLKELPVYFS
jgi:hypothetical protein